MTRVAIGSAARFVPDGRPVIVRRGGLVLTYRSTPFGRILVREPGYLRAPRVSPRRPSLRVRFLRWLRVQDAAEAAFAGAGFAWLLWALVLLFGMVGCGRTPVCPDDGCDTPIVCEEGADCRTDFGAVPDAASDDEHADQAPDVTILDTQCFDCGTGDCVEVDCAQWGSK